MNVILVGYMGVGKSTIGKKLASRIGRSLVDLDRVIEQRQGSSITEIIHRHGEEYFRELERDVVMEWPFKEGQIIATGGGTPCHHQLMEILKGKGVVVWLHLPVKTMVQRLINSKNRPLIAGMDPAALQEFIQDHYGSRESTYSQAHVAFSALNVTKERLGDLEAEIARYTK